MAKGGVANAIYLDYAKAFDSVPHNPLLCKLESYGVRGKTLTWINSIPVVGNQSVVINNKQSSRAPVLSGVPQGSVLGPILFITYINDLPQAVNYKSIDVRWRYKIVRQIIGDGDSYDLQHNLDKIQDWSPSWLLTLNPAKCKVITRGNFINIMYVRRYTVYGQELEDAETEKELGIAVDSRLKFDQHNLGNIKQVTSVMGLIQRVSMYLSPAKSRTLYSTFIRCHLECAQVVWSPKYSSLEDKI